MSKQKKSNGKQAITIFTNYVSKWYEEPNTKLINNLPTKTIKNIDSFIDDLNPYGKYNMYLTLHEIGCPYVSKENILRYWMETQKQLFKDGKLSKDREKNFRKIKIPGATYNAGDWLDDKVEISEEGQFVLKKNW